MADEGDLDPTVAEYIRDGISADGVLRAIELFEGQLAEGATTSDLCQQHIKPYTMPPGWTDEPELIRFDEDGADVSMNGWYKHTYVREADGERTPQPPPGTRSLCRLFAADPATAHLVGRPTHFLSHAWKYETRNLAAALRAFVDEMPEGSPPAFFWFDCFSLDQHAQSSQGSEWWRTTFMQAIGSMGHTVMMLSPWDDPIPLTRAWCLWELVCTVQTGATFSVCLGPAEQAAFEATILEVGGFRKIVEAFARIDVANAEAGNPHDKAMILGQAESSEGGLQGLNATAVGTLRRWFVGFVVGLGRRARAQGGAEGAGAMLAVGSALNQLGAVEESIELYGAAAAAYEAEDDEGNAAVARYNLANLLMRLGRHAEARSLLEAALADETERYGAEHERTLATRQQLAICMGKMGDAEGALWEEEAVLTAKTRTLGPTHADTLRSLTACCSACPNACRRRASQKVLVMSCPVEGTLDPKGGPPYDQKVMDKVGELEQRGKLKFGFDHTGSTSAAQEDDVPWAEIEELKAAGRIDEAKAKVRETRWFYSYQRTAKALIKIEMQGFGGVLVLLCIEGGLITQLEAEEMQRIANEAKQDAAKSNVQVRIQLATMTFYDFLRQHG
jgi:tetratricopeptide (TPR) repeat protein